MKPINHHVIVEQRPFDKKSKGGIAIPDNIIDGDAGYQNAQCEGILVAMASDAFDNYPVDQCPQIGDVVYFAKYDGTGKKYNNIPYRILLDEMIYCVSKKYIDYDEDLYAKEE